MRWLLFLAGLCAPLVHAIHESEVGVVDWHKLQIGVPLTGSLLTSLSFHVPRERQSADGLLLSATSSNVLAAVYAGNGSVAWRYIYDASDPIVLYQQHKDIVATLSGPGGSTLRTFDSSTGHLILEKRLHKPDTARILEPSDVGTAISFPSDDTSDVLALTSAYTIRRISSSGNVVWTWTSPDQTSSVIYSHILTTPDVIYALGLTKSFRSYNLHVTTLSPTTGSILASADIASDITSGPNSLLPLTTPKGPQVAWLEGEYLRTVVLTPSLGGKAALHTGAEYASVVDVGLSAKGHFVALKADGTGRVLKLDEKGVKLVWEFDDSAKSEHNAPSLYSGGLDADGHPYVARVFWSHALQKASVHVYAPHLADGKGLVSGFTFSFQTNVHGIIKHAALYAALPKPYDVIPYLALTTSTGAIQLWQGERALWTREEGLSRIGVAEMVEMPERKTVAAARGAETFLQRLQRQMRDAKDFPQYLIHFVKRFATGSYASATSRATPSTENDSLTRDAFGFRKVIVTATELGKVYGLDSSSGEVLWSRVLGLGWAAQTGGHIVPVKIFVTRTVADAEPEEGGPQAVLVAQRIADNGLVDTVVFHFEALTGKEVDSSSPPGDILHGTDIISGPLLGAYLLEKETKVVVLVDEFRQVYLYPDTPASSKRTSHRQFTGHQPVLDAGLQGRAQLHPTFASSLPPHEDILALVTRPSDPVASLGKSQSYKRLNGSDGEAYVGDATWEERTWKEVVRLREDMFWARVGGVR
ncbi:hypothetical protein EWM64_g5179 [Hericium alpestre]|uniref:EMC1 first beta-propeller domain-containing protein n=1 Tax=Hericium alpestre TaxID=135208 RepID=A0A4Y9ZXT4_9AGAM|nr:hypothetical protein EWM64_g5179 [Hericium alpestre]